MTRYDNDEICEACGASEAFARAQARPAYCRGDRDLTDFRGEHFCAPYGHSRAPHDPLLRVACWRCGALATREALNAEAVREARAAALAAAKRAEEEAAAKERERPALQGRVSLWDRVFGGGQLSELEK